MGTYLQEKLASLPSERQARIKAETVHPQATYMTLKARYVAFGAIMPSLRS